jgi:tripartite-type tricarboxylate transporter receptor subunit TctC
MKVIKHDGRLRKILKKGADVCRHHIYGDSLYFCPGPSNLLSGGVKGVALLAVANENHHSCVHVQNNRHVLMPFENRNLIYGNPLDIFQAWHGNSHGQSPFLNLLDYVPGDFKMPGNILNRSMFRQIKGMLFKRMAIRKPWIGKSDLLLTDFPAMPTRRPLNIKIQEYPLQSDGNRPISHRKRDQRDNVPTTSFAQDGDDDRPSFVWGANIFITNQAKTVMKMARGHPFPPHNRKSLTISFWGCMSILFKSKACINRMNLILSKMGGNAMYQCKRWYIVSALLVTIMLILTEWVGQVQAQEKYPIRPIEIIVAYPAGGAGDLMSRIMGDFLKRRWGVPVNVVNKPGGNTVPANVEVNSAKPDGYTILSDGSSTSGMLPGVVKNLPFNVMDRTFISSDCIIPALIFGQTDGIFKNLKDIEISLKRDPESLKWGSNGGASIGDYAMRQFFKAIGVDVMKTKPILTKGAPEMTILVAGGHIHTGCGSSTSGIVGIRGGTIKGLAVTSKDRNPGLPEVPTAAEQGYPTVNCESWYGPTGPPNMPTYIVEVWDKAIQEMVRDPEVISRWEKVVGVTPSYMNAHSTKEFVMKEMEEVRDLWGSK